MDAEDLGDADLPEKIERVVATWHGRVPKFHLSSQRPSASPRSHADFIDENDFREFTEVMHAVDRDDPYDLMIEAKAKDRAVLALREIASQPPPPAAEPESRA